MLVVADRNIPQVEAAFAGLCRVRTLPAAELLAAAVRDADLLLVRSTVRVGPALLEGSRVRFVATATIGIDHLDVPWLEAHGITWASAPGSNADSVLEWLAAALLTLHEAGRLVLPRLRVGIVGVGNVGARVERLARALGLPVLRCDPPRQAREGGAFVPLGAVLAGSDLVTLHVPLDVTTRGMLGAAELAQLPSGAWLVNASRGEVVDGAALAAALAAGGLGGAVLDVWPGEPLPAPDLVAACALATPHIAGHSLEGKLAGARMVHEAACRFLGAPSPWRPALPPQAPLVLPDGEDEALLLAALRSRYRIEDDDAALRRIVARPAVERAAAFRQHRDAYPDRRELLATPVTLARPRPRLRAALEVLGALVTDGAAASDGGDPS